MTSIIRNLSLTKVIRNLRLTEAKTLSADVKPKSHGSKGEQDQRIEKGLMDSSEGKLLAAQA